MFTIKTPITGLLLLALLGAACSGSGERSVLTVYAAASTRDALQALAPAYEREHPVELVFNFGSSGDLSKQIVAANQADLFLSADEQELDRVAAAGLCETDTRRDLLGNQLVVIEPLDPRDEHASSFSAPFAPDQLSAARIERISLANTSSVPAGRYAKAWLERCGVWSALEARVVPAVDVRAALAVVETGTAQVGIVYRTDAARSKKVRVVFRVPVAEGPRIAYPLAVLRGRKNASQAREFAQFLASDKARVAFENAGFVFLSAVSGWK